MIHHRHVEELDHAVRLARRAVSVQHVEDPDRLSSVLHERWYLGLTSQQAEVPAPGTRTWRAWGRLWTAAAEENGAEQVRLHLTAAPRTALHVLGTVTQRAHTWDHRWLLTSTAFAAEVPTPESTVLRLPTDALFPLRREILDLVADLRPFLAANVPALTRPSDAAPPCRRTQPTDAPSGSTGARSSRRPSSPACAATPGSRCPVRWPPSPRPVSTPSGPTPSRRRRGTGPGGSPRRQLAVPAQPTNRQNG